MSRILYCISKKGVDCETSRYLSKILGRRKNPTVVELLIGKLENENVAVVRTVCRFPGETEDPRSVEPLLGKLNENNSGVRRSALEALANIAGDKIDQKLLSQSFDAYIWIDPKGSISERRINKGAKELELSEEEVRCRYEALAEKFNLKLEWKISK